MLSETVSLDWTKSWVLQLQKKPKSLPIHCRALLQKVFVPICWVWFSPNMVLCIMVKDLYFGLICPAAIIPELHLLQLCKLKSCHHFVFRDNPSRTPPTLVHCFQIYLVQSVKNGSYWQLCDKNCVKCDSNASTSASTIQFLFCDCRWHEYLCFFLKLWRIIYLYTILH